MRNNSNLHTARKEKNDEFYTQLIDIEKELVNYKEYFKDKVVYCNCDDYKISNFVKYFKDNFETLGLKKLIATNYNIGTGAYKYEYNGEVGVISILMADGDFRSEECIEFLKEADIVVTNPPFSLFRSYMNIIHTYNKKFLVIGNTNAITYKEIFPLIKDNKLWLGCNQSGYGNTMYFEVPSNYENEHNLIVDGKVVARVTAKWFTNIEYSKRHHPIDLYRRYNQEDYPKYDNYDAINVDKVSEIPIDYDGVIGVPITFLGKYCPEQFEIKGIDRYVEDNPDYGKRFSINGKETYARILIRKK